MAARAFGAFDFDALGRLVAQPPSKLREVKTALRAKRRVCRRPQPPMADEGILRFKKGGMNLRRGSAFLLGVCAVRLRKPSDLFGIGGLGFMLPKHIDSCALALLIKGVRRLRPRFNVNDGDRSMSSWLKFNGPEFHGIGPNGRQRSAYVLEQRAPRFGFVVGEVNF